MRVLLIANPKSGANAAKKAIPHVEKFLAQNNVEVEVYYTTKEGDATQRTRYAVKSKKVYDAVIACGGDGTMNEVVNGLAGTGQAMGIIPLGTENVLAQEFKIPFDPRKAAKIILQCKKES